MKLRSVQIEHRDKDRRGSRPASPNDIRDELVETTVLLVHPIGQTKKTGTHFFGGFEVESVSGRVSGRVDDVIWDGNVS